MPYAFVLTGGGTGGHVFPALAVGAVLKERGHKLLFVGTREGMEAQLVPAAGFEMAFIRSGGLNRVGLQRQARTAMQLPISIGAALSLLRRHRPSAVFSTGGYVAGPVMIAAVLARIPVVLMEPNMVPGLANRKIARWVYRALVGFDETRAWFPRGKTEVTGLPVRSEFFDVQRKRNGPFTILITGASRGARTLNEASRESWPLFRALDSQVRLIHQTGATASYDSLAQEFEESGLTGEITRFIPNLAETFSETDLVVCRAGAGTVNELSAAGMAAILVPFPFAADDHQRRNAEALVAARAGRMIADQEMNGTRLFREVEALRNQPQELATMRANVRRFAKPGAARRAADVMEEAARSKRT